MISFCDDDQRFGPQSGCRSFDFTVLFENSILAILPSGLLFVAVLISTVRRWNGTVRLSNALLLQLALATSNALSLAAWTSTPLSNNLAGRTVVTALCVSLGTSVISVVHDAQQPYCGLIVQLLHLLILILDAARIRTFLHNGVASVSALFFSAFLTQYALRGVLFCYTNSPYHPASDNGLLRRVFIWSMLPTMWKGRMGCLELDNLPAFQHPSENLFKRFEIHWARERKTRPASPRIAIVLVRTFYGVFLGPVLPAILRTLAQIAQPLLVNAMIKFIDSLSSDSPQPAQWGWALSGMFALVFIIQAGSTGLYYYYIALSAASMRGALIEAIFRHTLQIDIVNMQQRRAANPISLMSTDVERLTLNIDGFHRLWSSFILVAFGLYIVHNQLGLAFITALIIIVISAVLVPALSKRTRVVQIRMLEFTDQRIHLISQLVRQIKNIKLSGSEALWTDKITCVRQSELLARKQFWDLFAIVVCITSTTKNMLALLTLGTYAIMSLRARVQDSSLTTARIFTAYTVLGLIANPLLDVGQSYLGILSAYAGLVRIKTYLTTLENDARQATTKRGLGHKTSTMSTSSVGLEKDESVSVPSIQHALYMSMHDAAFGWRGSAVLRNITIELPPNQLTMVIGRVGTGKSTFLAALLRESAPIAGSASFPWNRAAVSYCSQVPWLVKNWSIRDNIVFVSAFDTTWYKTVVEACALDLDIATFRDGDGKLARGLSGGQCARVALARAVYARNDILVLDDVFASLDGNTSKVIFDALFAAGGLLCGKTVFLATNQIHQLTRADWILCIRDGTIAEEGLYSTLYASKSPAGVLLRESASAVISPSRGVDSLSAEVTEQNATLPKGDDEVIPLGSISHETYLHYWRSVGWLRMSIYASLIVSTVGLQSGIPIYLQGWTTVFGNTTHSTNAKKLGAYLGGYTALETAFSVSISTMIYFVVMVVCQRASKNLHAIQLGALLGAPLQFFDAVPIGQILSRFSQDFLNIDSQFPLALYEVGYQGLSAIGSSILMVISVPYLATVIVLVGVMFFFVQRFYLATSQRLRRLDLANKSPLYTLFQEVSDSTALFVIRATGGEAILIRRNQELLARSQKPFYHTKIAFAWLASSICVMACIVNTSIAVLGVAIRKHASTGLLAVGLSQAVALQDIINTLLTNWIQLEMSAVSVERSLAYSRIAPEEVPDASYQAGVPDECWPREGEIVFENVHARYSAEGETVLNNVSLRIPPRSSCVIHGRTGSGKSTTFMALLRALDVYAGQIKIDGLDIQNVPLAVLRQRLTYVGQDVFVFEDSVRANLDPSNRKSDKDIWHALDAVHLRSFVQGLNGKLDCHLDGSAIMSRGQMQLLSLARALLMDNKIILLDEATGQLDFETDTLVQEVLRSAFRERTVVVISHRTQGMVWYDQTVRLDRGQVVSVEQSSEVIV